MMRAFVAVAACLAFCNHARRVEVTQPAADAALKNLVGLLVDDAPGFNMPARLATMRSARPGQPVMEEAVKEEKETIPEDEWEQYDLLVKKVKEDFGSPAAWLESLESMQAEAEAELEKAKAEMNETGLKEFEETIAKKEAEEKARQEAEEAEEKDIEAPDALRRWRSLEGNPFPIDAMDTFEGGAFAYWQIPKQLPYAQDALEPAVPLPLVRRLAALQTRFTNQLNDLGVKGKLEDQFIIPDGLDARSTVDLLTSDEDPATIIQVIKARRAAEEAKARSAPTDPTTQSAAWSAAVAVYGFNMFWDSMSPSGGEPTGAIKSKIDDAFGSFDNFKKEWLEAAKPDDAFWVWLEQDNESGSVKVVGAIEPPPERNAKGLMVMYNGPGMITRMERTYDGSRAESETYTEAIEAWLSKANFEFANANLA